MGCGIERVELFRLQLRFVEHNLVLPNTLKKYVEDTILLQNWILARYVLLRL